MSNLTVVVYVQGGNVQGATVPEGVNLVVVDLDNCQDEMSRDDCLAKATQSEQVW